MKTVAVKLLRGFAVVWTGLAVLLILTGMAGIWIFEGFGRVREVFSPFNFINLAAVLVTFLPAFGAQALASKLEGNAAAEQKADSNLDESIKLIQEYGDALEAAAAAKAIAVDVGRLPAPKEEIKAAIMRVLRSGEHKHIEEHLKVAYFDLSMFQPGVGSEPVRMLPMPNPIPDAADDDAIMAAAKAITDVGDEWKRWMQIVTDERNRLVSELKQAGFWND